MSYHSTPSSYRNIRSSSGGGASRRSRSVTPSRSTSAFHAAPSSAAAPYATSLTPPPASASCHEFGLAPAATGEAEMELQRRLLGSGAHGNHGLWDYGGGQPGAAGLSPYRVAAPLPHSNSAPECYLAHAHHGNGQSPFHYQQHFSGQQMSQLRAAQKHALQRYLHSTHLPGNTHSLYKDELISTSEELISASERLISATTAKIRGGSHRHFPFSDVISEWRNELHYGRSLGPGGGMASLHLTDSQRAATIGSPPYLGSSSSSSTASSAYSHSTGYGSLGSSSGGGASEKRGGVSDKGGRAHSSSSGYNGMHNEGKCGEPIPEHASYGYYGYRSATIGDDRPSQRVLQPGTGSRLHALVELLGKSSQETHKLDLMVEISQLQHSLTAAERDRKEMRDSLTTAEKRINDLQSRLNERTIEVTELRNRLARVENGGVPYTSSLERSESLKERTFERDRTLDRLRRKHTEIEGLKKAVEALMMSNKEKDKQIDDLKKLFRRYRRIDELIFNAQRDGRKSLDLLEFPDNVSDSSSTQLSATSSSLSADPALRDPHTPDSIDALERYTRPNMPYPSATSTPVTMQQSAGAARVNGFGSHVDASPLSVISHQGNLGARANSAEDLQQTLMQTPPTVTRKGQSFGTLPRDITGPILPLPSRGDPSNMHSLPPISPRKPFNLSQPLSRHNVTNNYRYPTNSESDTRDMVDNADTYSARSYEAAMSLTRPVHHSNTMPRCFGSGGAAKSASTQAIPNMASHHMSSASGSQSAVGDLDPQQRQQQQQQLQPPLRKQRGFRSFGKGFFKMRPGRWSNSAPNLAQTEQDEEALKDRMAQEYKQIQAHNNDAQQKQVKKNKSIKKTFFGKLKRSNSQELDEQLGDFRRGGVRATASGRIGSGWTGGQQFDLEVPFSRWDSDHVSTWLHGIGLSMYVGSCKRWVRHGEQLLSASNSDLEKELHIKNPLHRKKLQLALKTISEGSINSGEHIHRLDHNWVTRWLDDIGLPQYKDAFYDGMVDGRMLHSLAVDDLVYLKVTSTLHHYSIRAGIQVLRLHHFNPTCLRRRPLPEEPSAQGKPNEVMLWTNHRVMEWLRSIDLSEYAPNLRGSGVHGGLMVLENQFTAELLASMLNIPANKTLLRRHLSTHFVALIGSDTQQRKRETEQAPSYTPLTPAMKIKVKKGIFGHRRTRSMSEDDYLCPLDTPVALAAAETRSNGSGPPSCNGTLERERRGGAFA